MYFLKPRSNVSQMMHPSWILMITFNCLEAHIFMLAIIVDDMLYFQNH